jgi:hypothetical protein
MGRAQAPRVFRNQVKYMWLGIRQYAHTATPAARHPAASSLM